MERKRRSERSRINLKFIWTFYHNINCSYVINIYVSAGGAMEKKSLVKRNSSHLDCP